MRRTALVAVGLATVLLSLAPAEWSRAADSCGPLPATGGDVRLEVRTAIAAGTTIAYASVGTGRPLLLLNGTGSPMAEWDPALLAGLGEGRRVVVFDYPGLGRSGPAPGRYRFATMADWTADLIRRLDLGRTDVLGWSMGGFVAQQLAIRHPDAVRRLVLAGTNPGGSATVLGPRWVQDIDSDPDYDASDYLRTNYPREACAQRAGQAFLDRLGAAVDSGRYPVESTPSRTYDAMVAAEAPWLRSDANADALRHVVARTLVITGRRDVVTPRANSRIIAGLIPTAELSLTSGAGHSFLFQRPDDTARTVLEFLDR